MMGQQQQRRGGKQRALEEAMEASDAGSSSDTQADFDDRPNAARHARDSTPQHPPNPNDGSQRDWLVERLARAEGALMMQSKNERKMEVALIEEAARTKALQKKLEAAQNAADATTKVHLDRIEQHIYVCRLATCRSFFKSLTLSFGSCRWERR